MRELIQWAIGCTFMVLGGYICAFSYIRLIMNTRRSAVGDDRTVSGVPVVGPAIFICGWAITPLAWTWWVLGIVVLDIDTLLTLIFVPYALLRGRED